MRNSFSQNQNLNLKEKFFNLDFTFIFLIIALGTISVFAMYSTERGNFNYYTKSHLFRFVIFFIIFITSSLLSIKFWHRLSYLFYFFVLLLLLGVQFFGITASGSTRWISLLVFNLQPSELMKVALIVFLARYYNKIPAHNINSFRYFVLPIFILFIPFVLVINQPDLGTAMLLVIGGASIIWLVGIRIKYFMAMSILGVCLAPVVISFLKPYQKSRILTFFNPDRDPLGAGYQIIQSKIAVGSGGIFGKGFLNGSQSYLDYLPEKHTDFIFTLFSEEFGFIGSIVLLLIYALIIYKIIVIGSGTKNNFSRLYCYGFAASFFVYVAVNMSMVLGLLPIVGAPLPIMSYGGSSMLSMMIGLGIVMSCKVHSQSDIN